MRPIAFNQIYQLSNELVLTILKQMTIPINDSFYDDMPQEQKHALIYI